MGVVICQDVPLKPYDQMLAEDNVFNLSEEDRLVLIMSVLTRRCRVKIEELLSQPAKMQGAGTSRSNLPISLLMLRDVGKSSI